MVAKRTLGPFLGIISSLNDKYIGDLNASDLLNVRLEDGNLRARYGWSSLSPASSSINSIHGWDFVKGYDDDYAPQEEYLSFEKRSGTIQPWGIDPTSFTRTVITDAGTGLNLASGDWRAFAFDAKAYCHAIGGSVFVHDIGDVNSWLALDTARPDTPTVAPVLSFEVDNEYNPSEEVGGQSWAGATSGVISAFSSAGSAHSLTFDSVDGDDLLLNLEWGASPSTASTMEMTLDFDDTTTGNQDYSEVSEFNYEIHFEWDTPGYTINMNAGGLDTHVINNDGSPIDYNMFSDTTEISASTSGNSGAYKYLVRCVFDAPRDVEDWTDTRKLRLTWQNLQLKKTGGGSITYPATVKIRITPVVPFGYIEPDPVEQEFFQLKFGYAYYDSVQDVESLDVKEGGDYYISPRLSYSTYPGSTFLGNIPTMEVEEPSQEGVDYYRRYVYFYDEEVWRLIDELPIEDDEVDDPLKLPFELTYLELRTLSQRRLREYQPIGEIKYATPYNGSIVWLKRGGRNNVWMSQVGNPRIPADPDYDTDFDLIRGRTFSMSPNFDDEAVWAGQAARALILLGERGAYASTGTLPYEMTPPAMLPGSKGVYGVRAAARWKVEGDPGIAYVSNDLELWFANAYPGFDGTAGFNLIELSREIRGEIKSFLSPTDPSQLIVDADERGDSLWITYGNRAIVYRKPSLVDGKRQWEFYEYNRPWQFWNFDPYYGVRSISSSGHIDELEYDSTSSFEPIVSTLRDGGSAITSMYWESKEFHEVNRRVSNVLAEREDMTDPLEITVYSDRSTVTQTIPASTRHTRFGIFSQGWNLKYRIELDNEDQVVTKVEIDEHYPSSRQLNK